jgi:hypothetical protein
MTRRETVDVGGVAISYLTAGEGGLLVLLLHGTYWSRSGSGRRDGARRCFGCAPSVRRASS